MQAVLIVKNGNAMPEGCGDAVDTAHLQLLGSMFETLFLIEHRNVCITDACSVGYVMLI